MLIYRYRIQSFFKLFKLYYRYLVLYVSGFSAIFVSILYEYTSLYLILPFFITKKITRTKTWCNKRIIYLFIILQTNSASNILFTIHWWIQSIYILSIINSIWFRINLRLTSIFILFNCARVVIVSFSGKSCA